MQHEVLRHQVLTGLVRKFEVDYGVGKELFRQGVNSPTNEYTFDIIEMSRDLAKFRDPQAEAGIVSPMTKKKTSVILPTIREKKQLSGAAMNWLRRPGTDHQQYGKQMLADELAELNQRLEQRKEWWRWQLLNGGDASNNFNITFDDGVGNTVSATYDFDFSSDHKVDAGTAWSGTGGTTIVNDIIAGKKKVAQDYGKMPVKAYTTETVMSYLITNSTVKSLLGEDLKDQVATYGYIKKFLGLDIHVFEAGYVPDGGSWTNFLTDDFFVMCTNDPVGDEVTAPPVDPNAGGQTGKFSKSWVQEDPSGVWLLVEETWLAGLTRPESVYIVNTV